MVSSEVDCELFEMKQEKQEERHGQPDESVWSHYPEELHMAILKRLPWMDKMRLRRVCVLWNSILRDPCLLKSSLSPSLPVTHFCCLNPSEQGGEFQLYSPIGKSWQRFASAGNFRVIAAAAGLLLLQGVTNEKRTLILLNPLNRSQRQLPLPHDLEDMAQHQSCVFEMTMDRESDSIQILAGKGEIVGKDDDRNIHLFRHWIGWKFFVYNLRSNSWKLVGNISLRDEGHPLCNLGEQLPSATLLGKELYLLSNFHGTSSHLYKIQPPLQPSHCQQLNVEQDVVLSGVPLPPSSSYMESKLFVSSGRLLLVLRQRFLLGKAEDYENNLWHLCVFEFDFSSSGWKPMLSLPPCLARSTTLVTVDTDGGFMCFHNDDITGICDLSTQTWEMLPRPIYEKRKNDKGARIFLFEPRLDIIL